MDTIKDNGTTNLFPVRRKINSASLTQNEVADIIRLADNYGFSGAAKVKLLLLLRDRKKSASTK